MRISHTSVPVDDQDRAMSFYTGVLGFAVKQDIPLGEGMRWLTVVAPEHADSTELVLEPSDHPAVGPYKEALVADGIPITMYEVDDVQAEYERLTGLGVRFTQPPLPNGPVTTVVLDDTCGNLIQIVAMQ